MRNRSQQTSAEEAGLPLYQQRRCPSMETSASEGQQASYRQGRISLSFDQDL